MFKLCCTVIAILLILTACGSIERGIPKEAGNWRVEVGQAGNEFYEAPYFESQPPSENVLQLVRDIAPSYTEITKWEQQR
jgi:hypothetical protein